LSTLQSLPRSLGDPPELGVNRTRPRGGKAPAPHLGEPASDRLTRKLCRVVGDADTDPATIVGHIVHAIGHHLAFGLILEVVDLDALWVALRSVIGSGIFIISHELFLLGIDGNYRLSCRLEGDHLGIDMLELSVAIGMS